MQTTLVGCDTGLAPGTVLEALSTTAQIRCVNQFVICRFVDLRLENR
jgi:hypothetical protein